MLGLDFFTCKMGLIETRKNTFSLSGLLGTLNEKIKCEQVQSVWGVDIVTQGQCGGHDVGAGVRPGVGNPALPFTNWEALGKCFSFSGYVSLFLKWGYCQLFSHGVDMRKEGDNAWEMLNTVPGAL